MDAAGITQHEPIPYEGLRERFLPECQFRGRDNRKMGTALPSEIRRETDDDHLVGRAWSVVTLLLVLGALLFCLWPVSCGRGGGANGIVTRDLLGASVFRSPSLMNLSPRANGVPI